ncbi:acyltransferase family protein [Microvirga terrestris]|uniref:Acyltransferase n=1 Tax=Microvirga terrestris TaxID=2791024 RepID=A0ABS0HPE1_9HYPH|nr:acyltransferase family protein [Microvirga terrestris]MBF9195336.1 acyltransferase [Microvirga terrestris]
MANTSAKRQNYRPEIQGIRTIGALLVACFHIWGGRVSGGVDVFFVISGFLITGSLYKEVQHSQTIDVIAFWGRIAKRVAPMAYLVLTLTLAAAVLWMPQSRQAGFLSEVLYSAVHLENIKLMMNSVDYLAREEAPSPVQQFWALSVQVQFYALWPFLLLGVALAARKLRAGASAYLAALTAIFLGSLAYSVLQTRLDPSPTYFNTLARMWEFTLGGILAVSLPYVRLPERLREIAGWAGLLLVVSCGFLVPASAHYPGYIALWPTLGAGLVLMSGGDRTRFGADRILAWRPLVAIGEISFSFYLWHWPVLIFALLISGKTQLGLQAGLAVIAIALGGAYVTARCLEQPIHRSSIGQSKAWHIHFMGVALALPVIVTASVWLNANEREEARQREAIERRNKDYPGGSLPISRANLLQPGVPIYPKTKWVKHKHPNRCQQNERDPEVTMCNYGVQIGARKTIALVGGSHSEHWLPALEGIAHENNWNIVAITKSACAFMDGAGGRAPHCVKWNESVHDELSKLKPDAVVMTSTRQSGNSKNWKEAVPHGYLKSWERLAKHGITVIAIRDNSRFGKNNLECVDANPTDIMKCARPRAEIFDEVDPTTRLENKPENVSFIDLTDRFCDDTHCFPVIGNVLVLRDSHHISIEYARTLATPLGERMRQVRPDLFQTPSDTRESSVLETR